MTFSDIEAALSSTGRRAYAGVILAFLLDAHDRGADLVEKHTVVENVGITDTNVSAVARRLEEQGIIEILYWDTKSESPTWSSLRNGAWSAPGYRLLPAVLQLYRRC